MPQDDRITRAEARRRARLAARGDLLEAEPAEDEAEPQPSGGGFLSRLFPAAPPLPNRPDPLATYEGNGAFRPITQRIHLLRQSPLAWLLPGLAAGAGDYASLTFSGQSLPGLVGTFLLFGALIAAGWMGWQRPTLYGTAAAVVGFALATAVILVMIAQSGVNPAEFGLPALVDLFVHAVFMSGLGFLGGWYGGYLRRRQAQLGAGQRPRGSAQRRR